MAEYLFENGYVIRDDFPGGLSIGQTVTLKKISLGAMTLRNVKGVIVANTNSSFSIGGDLLRIRGEMFVDNRSKSIVVTTCPPKIVLDILNPQ